MNEDSTLKLTADQKLDLLLARTEKLETDFTEFRAFTEKLEKDFTEFRAFVEPKLYDTRPIWQQALAEIMEVRVEMRTVNERLTKIEKELRLLNHKFENQTLDFTNVRAEVRELKGRVEDMEASRQ